jgi:putative spermidine/putrescine transport system permease protein
VEGWTRLVLAHAIVATPYAIRVVAATLHGFDRSLEEAAMNLGATLGQAFRTVTLPVVKPGIAAAFLFAFMSSLDNLSVTVFVAQPGYYTIPVVLFGYVRDRFDPIIAVATLVMVGVAALSMLVAERIVGIERFVGLQKSSW